MTAGRKTFEIPARGQVEDFDLQAGSRGASLPDVVKRYMKTPGHLLATLRFFRNETVPQLASVTSISEEELTAYERGERPPLRQLSVIAKHYDADLRVLLEVFGYVSPSASEESLGLAAQFGGELSEQEKLDLKALVKSFSRSSRPR